MRGRTLRLVLMAELAERGSMSVAELAAAVADWGFALEGPPGRAVARALRREVRRGRVASDGRGGYTHRSGQPARVRPWPPPRRHLERLSVS